MERFESDIEREFFRDRVVLVTGGTGSFGEAILSKLLRRPVAEVRVFSRDEQKHYRMRGKYDDPRLRCLVGDIRDRDRVREVVRGTDIVFHAAALKHVPLTEEHPYEAVRTNLEGANHVIRACSDFGVERLVAISTDKAVEPVNVMGMTKAIQERLVTSASGGGRLVAGCVRFGNVLASNGSVLPYFQGLLDRGVRVLPLTAVEMTRFMMTLDEGADYALLACRLLEDGEIFVPTIPSFRVIDLAEVLLAATGGGRVEVVGIRPGEKLHETLLSREEACRAEERDGCFIVRRHRPCGGPGPCAIAEYRSDTARRMSPAEIHSIIKRPSYMKIVQKSA
jgi:UDP-N-acetylglucosamine 4,6-dehydratase